MFSAQQIYCWLENPQSDPCEMKLAALVFAISVVIQIVPSRSEEFVCQDGQTYLYNDCNICTCTTHGKMICALQACSVPGQKNNFRKNCTAGSTFQKDCNTCWCMKNGNTICTADSC